MSTGQIEPMRNIDKLYILEEINHLQFSLLVAMPIPWQDSPFSKTSLVAKVHGTCDTIMGFAIQKFYHDQQLLDNVRKEGNPIKIIEEKSIIIPEWVVDAVK